MLQQHRYCTYICKQRLQYSIDDVYNLSRKRMIINDTSKPTIYYLIAIK